MNDIFDSIRDIAKKYEFEQLTNKFQSYEKAVVKLEDAINHLGDNNEFIRDSIIKRFEYAYELSWKLLKVYIEDQGFIEEITFPKMVFKEAARAGLINKEWIWLDMLDSRALTKNIYDDEITKEIIDKIRNEYLEELKDLLFVMKDTLT